MTSGYFIEERRFRLKGGVRSHSSRNRVNGDRDPVGTAALIADHAKP